MAVSSVGMFGDGITHGSAGLVGVHVAPPALHRHDLERGADAEVLVEEPRQLADRHAVPHRDRELADERLEARHEHRALRRRRRRSDWADRRR